MTGGDADLERVAVPQVKVRRTRPAPRCTTRPWGPCCGWRRGSGTGGYTRAGATGGCNTRTAGRTGTPSSCPGRSHPPASDLSPSPSAFRARSTPASSAYTSTRSRPSGARPKAADIRPVELLQHPPRLVGVDAVGVQVVVVRPHLPRPAGRGAAAAGAGRTAKPARTTANRTTPHRRPRAGPPAAGG